MKRLGMVLLTSVTLLIAGGLGLAQSRRGGTFFEKANQITVTGTVDEVRHMVRRNFSGMHAVVKTDTDTFTVQLGPAQFLEKEHVNLSPGDPIEVTGWALTYGDAKVLIARQVKKGSNLYVLRDERGFPKWSRGAWKITGE